MEAQAAALANAQMSKMPKLEGASEEAAKAMGNPLSGKLATGAKTGAMIAGLQPRNSFQKGISLGKEWVFDGAEQNPNLQALLTSTMPNSVPGQSVSEVAGKNLKDGSPAKADGALDAKTNEVQTDQVRGDLASRGVDVRALNQALVNNANLEGIAGQMAQFKLQPTANVLPQDRLTSIANEANGKIGDLTGVEKQDAQAQQALNGIDSDVAEMNGEGSRAAMAGLLSGLDHSVSVKQSDRPQAQGVQGGSNSTLSGGEFLSMLSAVKGGAQTETSGDASQNNSGGKGLSGQISGMNPGVKKKVSNAGNAGDGEASGLEKSAALTAGLSANSRSLANEVDGVPKEMRAQVTQGGDTQNRMATDGLMSLSNNIRNMTPQGGGEIRVRLNPENLGELHVRVVTDGKQVGLQIQASDEKAKKILEVSMSDLRESLSRQHLNLGSIELTVGSSQSGSFAGNGAGNSGGNSQSQTQSPFHTPNQGLENMFNGGGNSNSGSGSQEGTTGREAWNASPLRTAVPGGVISNRMSATAAAKANGRLDVQA